jgi:hypothetical protein
MHRVKTYCTPLYTQTLRFYLYNSELKRTLIFVSLTFTSCIFLSANFWLGFIISSWRSEILLLMPSEIYCRHIMNMLLFCCRYLPCTRPTHCRKPLDRHGDFALDPPFSIYSQSAQKRPGPFRLYVIPSRTSKPGLYQIIATTVYM